MARKLTFGALESFFTFFSAAFRPFGQVKFPKFSQKNPQFVSRFMDIDLSFFRNRVGDLPSDSSGTAGLRIRTLAFHL